MSFCALELTISVRRDCDSGERGEAGVQVDVVGTDPYSAMGLPPVSVDIYRLPRSPEVGWDDQVSTVGLRPLAGRIPQVVATVGWN